MTENRGGDSWFRRRWSGGETGLTRWQERCDSRWRETTGKPYCLGETSIYRSEFNQLVACKSRKKTEIFKGLSNISKHLLEQTTSLSSCGCTTQFAKDRNWLNQFALGCIPNPPSLQLPKDPPDLNKYRSAIRSEVREGGVWEAPVYTGDQMQMCS